MILRLAGGLLVLGCVLLFEPGATSLLQRLWLPLAFGVGAAMVLHNILAITATGALLAALRSNLAGDWVSAIAYPAIGLACAGIAAGILLQRYRRYSKATRAARVEARASRQDNASFPKDEPNER